MYDLLLDAFVRLPGEALISEIRDGRFDALVLACTQLGAQGLCDGAGLVASFRPYLAAEGPRRVLDELSVDRTALTGAACGGGPRPPYERLYITGSDRDGAVLTAVQSLYRKAGLLLDDDAGEPSDFLFVELDFVKRLCLEETEAWSHGRDGRATQALELQFLREHPGRWAGAYCADAGKYARTDFYRGFLAVLDNFMEAEIEYLEEGTISAAGGR